MFKNIISSLFIILTLFSTIEAQNICSVPCLGKDEWKEERMLINNDENLERPFNSMVKLNVKKWYAGYYGTGTFLNNTTIITAHHNISRKANITRIDYKIEGQSVRLRKKDYTIFYYSNKSNKETDIAIIKIHNPKKIHAIETSFVIENNAFSKADSEIHLTGYPCDKGGNEKWDKSVKPNEIKFDTPKKLIGYPMYTCKGDSGAPLWFFNNGKYYIVGIHHGGNEGHPEFEDSLYNLSVYLNDDVLNWLIPLMDDE